MINKLFLAATLALLSSAPAVAQDSPAAFDSRWTPYLGCWTIVQDQRGQSAPVPAGTMVCVRPSGRFGIAITTTVDGKNVLEQTIVADGSPQPLSEGDCRGTQTSDWSRDGERLFTRVELDCANRPKRAVSGITLLANGQWVDAQATVIDGNSDVRLRRYRRSSDRYTGPAGMTTAPLTVEDVIEASAKVQSEALEAALDEANARLTLNSRVLKQLADNGVSPNVIDLLVAQAYPEKFQIDRGYPTASSSSYGGYSGSSMGSSSIFMGSTMYPTPMYDPFYSSYYYYSPFAYPYYWGPSYSYRYGSPFYRNYYNYNNYYGFGGFAGGGYYGGPSGSSGGNAQPGSPDSRGGDGVVVNGRGYTRVRPAGSTNSTGTGESATPTSRTPGTSRGVRSAGSSDSSSSSSSSPSSSSGSSSSGSSSGASSGGYSGGGGDSGGGRTAQPR
jgi:hypothetical protein